MIPTEIHGLFIELNPRLNERPWQGEGLWALFPVSYKCNLRKCSPKSSCLPLRWWFPSGPPGDVNGSTLWCIRAFRGLEHLTLSVQNCLASLAVSPGSTAAWICKALQVLAAYNHQALYNIHLSLCPFALFGKCTRPSYNFHFKKQQPCKEIWEIAGQWQWYFKVQNLCDRHFVGVARYTLAELPACGDLKQENEEHVGLA